MLELALTNTSVNSVMKRKHHFFIGLGSIKPSNLFDCNLCDKRKTPAYFEILDLPVTSTPAYRTVWVSNEGRKAL
jgi:hypothetical protein